eukprot:GHUV01011965.1.p1 GENE.GHUV01011965.1~~GHUV01011965.1.p1  ORF type:complete len:157 (+),score=27.58 GHUV01011965.1:406-876(+)
MQATSSSTGPRPLQAEKHLANRVPHCLARHVQRLRQSSCKSNITHTAEQAASHLPEVAVAVAAAVLWGPTVVEVLQQELQPRKCMICLGTGFLICKKCQGRGKLGLSLPGDAAAVSSCTHCSKRGRCRCDECKATGLKNNWLWQPAADPGWGPRGN